MIDKLYLPRSKILRKNHQHQDALIGGLVGATIAKAGISAVHAKAVMEKVVIPMFVSPVLGFGFGFILMLLLLWMFRRARADKVNVPLWVAFLCATFMFLGTAAGGRRYYFFISIRYSNKYNPRNFNLHYGSWKYRSVFGS